MLAEAKKCYEPRWIAKMTSNFYATPMPFRRIILWILAGLFSVSAVALVGFLVRNRTEPFSGDGTLEDGGFWSYPRYRVAFPKLDLTAGTNHLLTFRGMPTANLFFDLRVDGLPKDRTKMDNFDLLKASGTRLRVDIRTAEGKPFAEGNDVLTNWVVNQSIMYWSVWHTNLPRLEFDGRTTYAIRIELLNAPPEAAPLTVIPMFWGGGWER